MLRKLGFWLILVPVAIVIVMFAVANRQMVSVSFDPFDAAAPAAVLELPLFAVTFIAVIAGVLVGGAATWLRQSHHRRAARQHASDAATLRRQVDTLNTRLGEGSETAAAARLGYTRTGTGEGA